MNAIVLADDLTGAADCQAALWPRYTSLTWLADRLLPAERVAADFDRADVLLLDTETRFAGEEEAAAALRAWLPTIEPHLASRRSPLVYLKVDSTLRGHIALEVELAARLLDARCVPLVPANPRAGRQTRGGAQLVHGLPLHRSAFARDPVHPIRDSEIASLFRGSGVTVEMIPLSRVRGETRQLADLFGRPSDTIRVLVADAETEDDLDRIARAIDAARPPLVCGSAGLIGCLRLGAARRRRARAARPVRADVALIVAGTLHPTTAKQLQAVARTFGVAPVIVGPDSEPAAVVAALGELLAARRLAVLGSPRERLSEDWEFDGPGRLLAEVVAGVDAVVPLDLLVLVGGRTAYHVCKRLGISSFEMRGLLAAELPLVESLSEPARRLVLKPGGFGTEGTLVECLRSLGFAGGY